VRSHFLGSLCRFLNRRGILTHPRAAGHVPCRTVVECVDAWRIVPRRLVLWRVRRTLAFLHGPERFARMELVNATSRPLLWPKRGVQWHITYTTGCNSGKEMP